MAYNTVSLKTDADGKPIPQYYNPVTNQYEVTQGENGATRTILYDVYGNPVDLETLITAITNTLNARHLPIGASTEEKQDEIISKLANILSNISTEEKQNDAINKLSDILSNLPSNYSTETKQDEIISNLVDILTKLQDGIKQDGNTMEYYGKSTDTKPTDVKVGATFFEIDTKEVYIYDGESWVVI